jgi:soluble lytic murein transglycosylase-like protein
MDYRWKNGMVTKRLYGWLLPLLLIAACLPVQAEIYKYKDWDGNILFSDKPMKGPYRLMGRVGAKYGSGNGSVTTTVAPARKPYTAEAYRKRVELYTPLINATARLVRVSPELLHAVIRAESSYRPNAVSKAGAVGLMQLMPGTAKRYGVTNRNDPVANLSAGANYLRDLLEMFDNNTRLAVAAYNAGENAVIRRGNRIPPYPETIEYVRRVMLYYEENLRPTLAAND